MGEFIPYPNSKSLSDFICSGACHNTMYGSPGSMGPDLGLVCRIYKDFNCPDNKLHLDTFLSPGIGDYQKSWWLNNAGLGYPASYRCKPF